VGRGRAVYFCLIQTPSISFSPKLR
jgi:hypothetical protein